MLHSTSMRAKRSMAAFAAASTCVRVEQIGGQVQALVGRFPVSGFEPIGLAIEQAEIGATRCKGRRDRAAEIARGASHQHRVAGEIEVSAHDFSWW